MVTRRWLAVAGLSMALAFALGALAAHALRLDGVSKEIFATAHRYHVWHSLALLPLSLIDQRDLWLELGRRSLFGGLVLFSGSLYLLVFTGNAFWSNLTPFGGVLLILGWVLVASYGWRYR